MSWTTFVVQMFVWIAITLRARIGTPPSGSTVRTPAWARR
jgi:hypothetical protein